MCNSKWIFNVAMVKKFKIWFSRLLDQEISTSTNALKFNLTLFHTLEEIYTWLDEIAAAHSDKASILDIGKSHEGRSIKGIHIKFNEVSGEFSSQSHNLFNENFRAIPI